MFGRCCRRSNTATCKAVGHISSVLLHKRRAMHAGMLVQRSTWCQADLVVHALKATQAITNALQHLDGDWYRHPLWKQQLHGGSSVAAAWLTR